MAKPQRSQDTAEGAKSSYDRWVESEGIPVINTFFVEDIGNVELEWWERKGGQGAFLQMEGAGQVNNSYICEIPPGKSLKVQRQLVEETIYVISGRGATTVWNRDDRKQTFVWQGGSQIEYADEEPMVRDWFNAALAKRGVQSQMAKHYEKKP